MKPRYTPSAPLLAVLSWTLLSLALIASLQAADRIKMATLAPTGSSYHKSLLALREAWRKASNGKIELVIYADGKLGSETDTVGLMAVNSVQAALLTAVGLSEIEPAVSGLQNIPMSFHDLDEVDHVGRQLQPMLERRLEKKGFVVLFWSDGGWVHFFSRKPVTHVDDLRKLKLFCWAGSPEQVQIYKSAGFDALSLETADIVPSLQTGLIDAVPLPPVAALTAQVDSRAPYMLQLNWAPLVGACVVRKETWDKVDPDLQKKLLESAAVAGREIKENSHREMVESIKSMEKRGLKVTPVTPEIEAEWRAAAEAVYPKIRGQIVPDDIFDEALRLIKAYRATKAPSS